MNLQQLFACWTSVLTIAQDTANVLQYWIAGMGAGPPRSKGRRGSKDGGARARRRAASDEKEPGSEGRRGSSEGRRGSSEGRRGSSEGRRGSSEGRFRALRKAALDEKELGLNDKCDHNEVTLISSEEVAQTSHAAMRPQSHPSKADPSLPTKVSSTTIGGALAALGTALMDIYEGSLKMGLWLTSALLPKAPQDSPPPSPRHTGGSAKELYKSGGALSGFLAGLSAISSKPPQ